MLDDAAIERFSRQILLPEVGGRGQERLCATVATVRGSGDAAAFAATLLQAAGVRVVVEAGEPGRVQTSVDIMSSGAGVIGVGGETRVTVATLVGRPCVRCAVSAVAPAPADPAMEPADAQTLGALVAAETLRAALGLAREGRVQEIDLARGAFTARPLPATSPCPDCPSAAGA